MKIKNIELEIDVIKELELLGITDYKITGDTISACSPLREETHPSFYIYYKGKYQGFWGDRGGLEETSKGYLTHLISFIRQISLEEAEQYLVSKYNYKEHITKIPFRRLDIKQNIKLDLSQYQNMLMEYSYLNQRKISSHYAKVNGCREDDKKVAFVWHDVNGNMKNIKYRDKQTKRFYYEKGELISNMVYSIYNVYKHDINTIAICESEINALSWQSIGVMGVALGGSSISDKQAQLIRDSGVINIILSADNDVAGTRLNNQIKHKLGQYRFKYFNVNYGIYNDVNDLLVANLLTKSSIIK